MAGEQGGDVCDHRSSRETVSLYVEVPPVGDRGARRQLVSLGKKALPCYPRHPVPSVGGIQPDPDFPARFLAQRRTTGCHCSVTPPTRLRRCDRHSPDFQNRAPITVVRRVETLSRIEDSMKATPCIATGPGHISGDFVKLPEETLGYQKILSYTYLLQMYALSGLRSCTHQFFICYEWPGRACSSRRCGVRRERLWSADVSG